MNNIVILDFQNILALLNRLKDTYNDIKHIYYKYYVNLRELLIIYNIIIL